VANDNSFLQETQDMLLGLSPEPLSSKYQLKDNENLRLVDPDTVAYTDPSTGNTTRVRLPGIDALEVEHMTTGGIKMGQYGGAQLHDDVLGLVNKGGFNKVVLTDEIDETGDRVLGDLVNAEGETLSRKMLYHGLVTPTRFSSADQINAYMLGRFDKTVRSQRGIKDEWDIASDNLLANLGESTEVAPLAINEAQYASAPHLFSGVQTRDFSRTMGNKARSIMSTAWGMGSLGIAEGAYGALDLIGDALDVQGLQRYGKGHANKIKREISRLPELEDQQAFDENGNWTIDGIPEFAKYIYTNAVISAPYMMSTMLATALAAPTMGLSLAVPASVYAGQVYNEQEEKNPAAAFLAGTGMAALDILGLRIAGGAGNFMSKEGRNKIVAEVAKKKGISLEDAESLVTHSFTTAIHSVTKDTRDTLAQDIAMKQAVKGIGRAAGVGVIGEGLTETAQELIAMAGEMNDVDQNEAKSRLLNALVAGGSLGGAFGTASGTTDYMTTRNAVSKTFKTAEEGDRDLMYQSRDRELHPEGKVYSRDELIENFETLANDSGYIQKDLEDIAAPERQRRKERGVIGNLYDYFKKTGIKGAYDGHKQNTMNPFIDRGPIMRAVGSIFGANNIYHGVDDQVALQIQEGALKDQMLEEEQAMEAFGVNTTKKISDIIYHGDVQRFLAQLMSVRQGMKYSSLKEAAANRPDITLKSHADKLEAILEVGERLYTIDQFKSQTVGTSLKEKVISKEYLEKNIEKFKRLLVEKFDKVTPEMAEKIANELRDVSFVEDIGSAVDSLIETETDVATQKSLQGIMSQAETFTTTNLYEVPEFAPFFDNDLFYNLEASNAKYANSTVNNKYFGRNGSKFAAMLEIAEAEGEITQAEKEHIAAEVGDYIKMRKGSYGRIRNETLRKVQSNALFFTTLNQLPLATLASLVEVAVATRMLSPDLIYKTIAPASRSAALEMHNYVNEIAAKTGVAQRKSYLKDERRLLRSTGYLQEAQGARQRNGVDVVSGRKNRVLNGFFKAIGLQGFTNFTRTIRLSIAGGYILEQVEIISDADPDSIGALEARENLVRLGVDIDGLVEAYNKPEDTVNANDAAFLEKQLLNGSIAFTDLGVAHPRSGNRPKFYDDKRLAMLMAFQGFIGSFTSTILPQIYKGLVGRTIGARMESVKTIALLIALGFMAQALRDLVKYGEAPDWLDDEEKFQRAVYSSGLLGSFERVYDLFDPLYPQRSTGVIDSVGNLVEGEIPTISYGSRIYDTIDKAIDGDYEGATKGLVKSAPFVGPLHQVAVGAGDAVDKALKGEY
jgi:hypothetical protein